MIGYIHGVLAAEPKAPPRHLIFEFDYVDAEDTAQGYTVTKVLVAEETFLSCMERYQKLYPSGTKPPDFGLKIPSLFGDSSADAIKPSARFERMSQLAKDGGDTLDPPQIVPITPNK